MHTHVTKYEEQLRRRARRLGMTINKSRTRDPNALDHGLYALVDDQTGAVVLGGGELGLHSCTLDDIDGHLARLDAQPTSEVASWVE